MPMLLGQVPRENIASRIYRSVKTELMTGRLRPGETITLRSLTEELGVSQTPVREALLQLASEKVLTVSPGRSLSVPVLTEAQLTELRDIRLELECLATRRAVPGVDAAARRRLAAIHEGLAAARRAEDREGVLRGNLDFHFTLYAASGMPHLVAMIENLWVQTAAYLSFLYVPPFPSLPGPHPHSGVLEALEKNDAAAAVRHVRRDILDHGELLMASLRRGGLI
ncbi:GntR family transcriptional regulator [Teichococcus oryzae]|uniref:GntR family transcriptional regulator n=1 Tax=Teichococcus oryzae TaxID=1608942 RepID=A0A5B2TGH2_9PROT|nr:GntR family transcriptional regulator [Pseudoroseomonas oryzae]KAA2213572.1 GntR family transcriptional regulator [Pseudoroseomonas oryzae]